MCSSFLLLLLCWNSPHVSRQLYVALSLLTSFFKLVTTSWVVEDVLVEDGELVTRYTILPNDWQTTERGEDGSDEHEMGKRDYNLDAYIMSCNHTLDMYPDKVIRIISPHAGGQQYPGGLVCDWEIIGRDDCKPVIACGTLDLRHSDCSEDALVVSDGTGGEKHFCGPNLGFQHPLKARTSSLYLYVQFRTGDSTKFDRLYKGISCNIRCHKSPHAQNQEPLPEGELNKEEYTVLCGKKFDAGNDRIVGGQTADKREFPWQAALVRAGSRKPFCGGSLINSNYILTAAHCVLDDLDNIHSVIPPASIEVLLRAHVLEVSERQVSGSAEEVIPGKDVEDKPEEREEIRLKLDHIIVHRLYNKFVTHENDIALLQLRNPLNLKAKSTPTPVCLPTATQAGSDPGGSFEGQTATVTGWGYGHENARGTAKVLQKLDVPIIPWKKCHEVYNPTMISLNMLCAGYLEGGKDACQGDSGGPLVLKKSDQFVQIGVVSFGEGCARKNRPGVFTSVPRLLPWIHHWTRGSTWPRAVK